MSENIKGKFSQYSMRFAPRFKPNFKQMEIWAIWHQRTIKEALKNLTCKLPKARSLISQVLQSKRVAVAYNTLIMKELAINETGFADP